MNTYKILQVLNSSILSCLPISYHSAAPLGACRHPGSWVACLGALLTPFQMKSEHWRDKGPVGTDRLTDRGVASPTVVARLSRLQSMSQRSRVPLLPLPVVLCIIVFPLSFLSWKTGIIIFPYLQKLLEDYCFVVSSTDERYYRRTNNNYCFKPLPWACHPQLTELHLLNRGNPATTVKKIIGKDDSLLQ